MVGQRYSKQGLFSVRKTVFDFFITLLTLVTLRFYSTVNTLKVKVLENNLLLKNVFELQKSKRLPLWLL